MQHGACRFHHQTKPRPKLGFRLSLASIRVAINRLFFRGTTAPTVAVASPQVALVTVPVVHEVTPEISREPTPDLPPAVLHEAAAHATAEASAEASPEETPEVSAEAPAGVTELVPVPERHDTTRLEDDPVAPAAIAAAPESGARPRWAAEHYRRAGGVGTGER